LAGEFPESIPFAQAKTDATTHPTPRQNTAAPAATQLQDGALVNNSPLNVRTAKVGTGTLIRYHSGDASVASGDTTMKKPICAMFCYLLLLAPSVTCVGQHATNPVEATLCDLYQHPEQYIGKMVKVRGSVAGNYLWIDAFTEKSCPTYMRLIVVFPDKVNPAPGFELVRDKSLKELEDALYHPRPIHIEATFEGRFDAAFYWRDQKRIAVGQSQVKGYGKKHDYDAQIVLYQVSDVVAKPLPRK
jgi:hypothetical protein